MPAGRVAVQLLLADGDAAVKAAVAAGGELDPWSRWAVLQFLEACRAKAQEYAPAAGLIRELIAAWTARHGSEQPRPRRVA